jgi:arginase family enzyme
MSDAPESRLRLVPSLRAAHYAGATYLFDAGAGRTPTVVVPTQRVKQPYADVVVTLRAANPSNDCWPLERIRSLFADDRHRRALEVMVARGYLHTEIPASPPTEDAVDLMRDFLSGAGGLHFHRPRLFNLPGDLDDDATEVVFAGVPVASSPTACGTVTGPAAFRTWTSRSATWFDVFEQGIYSEVGADDSLPELLCRTVVLGDAGDLGEHASTPAALFSELRTFVNRRVEHGQSAVFAGGDHAITFPLVDAYQRRFPDLVLVHLDAHNDLFYAEGVGYSHASPISSLLRATRLAHVFSLGLRTGADDRIPHLSRIVGDQRVASRIHPYSLAATRRMLYEPARLDALVATIDAARPCYLSIDLDVLSADLVGRVSTPAGAGLDWWELYEIVRALSRRLRFVACDVVELDVLAEGNSHDLGKRLSALLLQIIHGVAGQTSWAVRR